MNFTEDNTSEVQKIFLKLAYEDTIKEVYEKFPPKKIGGCYQATKYIIEKHSELKEMVVSIKNKQGDIKHCIAITPEGFIIDTQHWQFGLIQDLQESLLHEWLFTKEEHESYLERYEVG